MHIIIGASTYHVSGELDAEAFCAVLRSLGPAALWPWLLRYDWRTRCSHSFSPSSPACLCWSSLSTLTTWRAA